MSIRRLHASAPAKMLLFGEYAVLYGAPALVTALPQRAHVFLEVDDDARTWQLRALPLSSDEIEFRIDARNHFVPTRVLPQALGASLQLCVQVVQAAVAATPQCPWGQLGGRLHLDTSEFSDSTQGIKLGLGSSAALVVALDGALRAYAEGETPAADFRRLVSLHRAAQGGRGSGADVAASLFGGVQSLQNAHPDDDASVPRTLPEVWLQGLYAVAVFSGKSCKTASMIAAVDAFRQGDPVAFNVVMDEMRCLSQTVLEHWRAGRSEAVCGSAGDYGEAMRQLGEHSGVAIVSQEHQRIASLVAASGAHYKPSGAGGGDCGLIWCCAKAQAQSLLDRMHKAGYRAFHVESEAEGQKIAIGE